MPKFRKKPLVVEAVQWFPGVPVAGVIEGPYTSGDTQSYPARCPTLEGVFGVMPGDWIITGVEGERWPVKDSIFRKSYDPVLRFPRDPNPVNRAIMLIEQYGSIDGAHHKQWVLDQVLRILLDSDYEKWRAAYNDEPGYATWDEGIAP